jgi:hypothetical protein
MEHNHPDSAAPFIEFTVCCDDSVVDRAKLKEDKCRLGEEAQATPCGGKHDSCVYTHGLGISCHNMCVYRIYYIPYIQPLVRHQGRNSEAAVIVSVKAVWKTLNSSGWWCMVGSLKCLLWRSCCLHLAPCHTSCLTLNVRHLARVHADSDHPSRLITSRCT